MSGAFAGTAAPRQAIKASMQLFINGPATNLFRRVLCEWLQIVMI